MIILNLNFGFSDADTGHIILVIICVILTVICLAVYIEEVLYILRAAAASRVERTRPIWILGVFPVSMVEPKDHFQNYPLVQ